MPMSIFLHPEMSSPLRQTKIEYVAGNAGGQQAERYGYLLSLTIARNLPE